MTLKPWAQPKLEINGLVLYLLSLSKKKTLLAVKKRNLPVTSSLWSHRKKGLSTKIETSKRAIFWSPIDRSLHWVSWKPRIWFQPTGTSSFRFDSICNVARQKNYLFLSRFVCSPSLSFSSTFPQVSVSFLLFFRHRAGTGYNFFGLRDVPGVLLRAWAWDRKVSLSLSSAWKSSSFSRT